VTQAVVRAEYFVSGFATTPGCAWNCMLESFEELIYLPDPNFYQRTTSTVNPTAPNLSTIVRDENLFPGWPGPPQGWESDVPYAPGGFVSSRRLRPAGSPDVPGSYQWSVTRTFSKPYSYEEALEDFMVLLGQAKVTAPTINMCLGASWEFYYDRNGVINGPALPFLVPITGAECWLGPQSPFGQTPDRQGWTVGGAGFTVVARSQTGQGPVFSHFDDMGARFSASFLAKKSRVRMDRTPCVWRIQSPTEYEYDVVNKGCARPGGNPAQYGGAPQCPPLSCQFIPLPTQGLGSQPDPACPVKFPRFVEFLALPEGLDPETEEGEPANGVWYIWAGCSACFGS
jgi:hypothetical protein